MGRSRIAECPVANQLHNREQKQGFLLAGDLVLRVWHRCRCGAVVLTAPWASLPIVTFKFVRPRGWGRGQGRTMSELSPSRQAVQSSLPSSPRSLLSPRHSSPSPPRHLLTWFCLVRSQVAFRDVCEGWFALSHSSSLLGGSAHYWRGELWGNTSRQTSCELCVDSRNLGIRV